MASSCPPLRRLVALLNGRVRANHRLLTSPAAAERASTSPLPEAVHMTEGCVRRLKELHAKEPSAEGKMLRLSVEAGGCSGFQYSFSLDNRKTSEDRVFEKDGVKLVVDDISYDFVKGATVDYEEELIRSAFVVITSHAEKERAVYEFYNGLLGLSLDREHTINLEEMSIESHDLVALEGPFSVEEVWETICQLPSDKAPGPDGFIKFVGLF